MSAPQLKHFDKKACQNALKEVLRQKGTDDGTLLHPFFPSLMRKYNTKALIIEAMEKLHRTDPVCAYVLQARFMQRESIAQVALASSRKTTEKLTNHTVSDRQQKGLDLLCENLMEQELALRNQTVSDLVNTLPHKKYSQLFGVTSLLDQLSSHLCNLSSAPIQLVHGIGGIGKTAIARESAEWALKSGHFAHSLWHRFEPNRLDVSQGRSPDEAIRQLINKLSYHTAIQAAHLPEKEKVRTIKEALSDAPFLIVLDNLEQPTITVESLRLADQFIQPPSKLVVTSRNYPLQRQAGYAVSIPLLSFDASLALIRDQARICNFNKINLASDSEIAPIIELVGGNPLALKIASPLADQFGLSELNKILTGGRSTHIDQDLYGYVYLSAWNALGEIDKAVLQSTLFTAESGDPVSYLEQVSTVDPDQFHQSLAHLHNRSLVEIGGDGLQAERTVSIHPLTRQFLSSNLT